MKRLVVAAAVAALCLVSVAAASAAGGPGAFVADPHVLPGPPLRLGPIARSIACPFPGAACYGPAEIAKAYDFPTDLTGAGQTIVVFGAFGSPTIESDLATFDRVFQLPAPNLTILGPNGSGDPSDPSVQGWQQELSLDVEYAHALAPGANIVLSVAESDDNRAIIRTMARTLPRYPRAIVSLSFAADESLVGSDLIDEAAMHGVFILAQLLGDTVLGGAGDLGATNGHQTVTATYPASDPLVTSIGGTEGLPYPDGLIQNGGYGGEQVWNESEQGTFPLATGGATSAIFRAPSWQRGVTGNRMRTVPDVAFNAAIDGGLIVVWGGPAWLVGGTSAGAPQWAAIVALANEARAQNRQGPLGYLNPTLYQLVRNPNAYARDFHDITVGDNAWEGTPGFPATPGYDLATGWGTPQVSNLVADLSAPGHNGHRR